MAEQYISIKVIQDKVTRHPLLQGVTLENIIDYTTEFMGIVGVPEIFINKVVTLSTDNHKIKLPCDYIRLIQMRGKIGVYKHATNTFHLMDINNNRHEPVCEDGCVVRRIRNPQCDDCTHNTTCDEYQFDYNKVECICMLKTHVAPSKTNYGNYYIIQNNYIYLSNESDTVDISYYAILTDLNGYPMIPNDEKFIRALVAYIRKERFNDEFDAGHIDWKVLEKAEQRYAWAVGSCESGMKIKDLPHLEEISNVWKSMVTKNNEYANTFRSNGDEVIFKTH